MSNQELLSVAELLELDETIIRDSFDPEEYPDFLSQCREAGKSPTAEFVRMLIEGA